MKLPFLAPLSFVLLGDLKIQDNRGARLPFSTASKLAYAKRSAEIEQERKEWLQQRLGISGSEIETLVKRSHNGRYDALLGLRTENVAPTLDWLQKRLKLNKKELNKVVSRSPELLGFRVETIDSKLEWFQRRLNVSDQKVKRLVTADPRILQLDIDGNIKPKLNWLEVRLEMDTKQLAALLDKNPRILCYSVEHNLSPKLQWLESRLDLDTAAALREVVLRAQGFLTLSVDTLEEKFRWFELKIGCETAIKRIRRYPSILMFSIQNNDSKLSWFKKRLQLNDEEAGKLLKHVPLLKLSIEHNVEPKLNYLQSRLALNDEQLGRMACSLPSILSCHIENNIDPTFEFYTDLLGEKEGTRLISNDPRFLSYSLEKRLKPRLAEASSLGMIVDKTSIEYLAKCTDERWSEKLERYELKQLQDPSARS